MKLAVSSNPKRLRPLFFVFFSSSPKILSITGGIACLMSWLWFDDYRPWIKAHSELWAAVAMLLWLAALASAKGFKAPRFPWIAGVAAVPLALAVVQWAVGILPFTGDVLLAAIYFGTAAVAVFLGAAWRESPTKLATPVLAAVAMAAIINAAIGWAQWLQLQEPFGMYVVQGNALGDPARGNLGQSNHLASLCLLGVLTFVAMYEQRVIGLPALAAAALFLSATVALSNSRTGILNIVLLGALLLWKARHAPMQLAKAAVVGWVAASLAMVAILPVLSGALLIRQIDVVRTSSVGERWLIWKQCAEAVWQSPWWGHGFEQMTAAQAIGALAHPAPAMLVYTHAHSLLLDSAVWFGVPATLLMAGIGLWWLWKAARTASDPGTTLALAALVVLFVHSLLEFPFAYLYFLVAAGLLAGWVDAAAPARPSFVVPRGAVIGIAVVGMALGCLFARDYLLAEEDFRVVRFENTRIGTTPSDYRAPDLLVLSQLGTMLQAARIQPARGMSPGSIDTIRRAAERFPYGNLRFRYARALALNGQAAEGRRQMAIIQAMFGGFYHRACLDEVRTQVAAGETGLAALLPGGRL